MNDDIEAINFISDAGPDNTYGLGDTIEVEFEFDDDVTVTGVPTLTLTLDSGTVTMSYSAAESDEVDEAVFTYTVQATDMDANGPSIVPAGGNLPVTVPSGASIVETDDGEDVDFDYTGTGIHADIMHRVDGSIGGSSDLTLESPSDLTYLTTDITGTLLPEASGGDGDYTYTVTRQGGAPLGYGNLLFFPEFNELSLRRMGVGTYRLTHSVTDGDGQRVSNDFTVVVRAVPSGAPTITGHSFDRPASGAPYATGDTITYSVTFSEAVTVTGQLFAAINIGDIRYLTDTTDTSGTTLSFSLTVDATDTDTDGITAYTNNREGRNALQIFGRVQSATGVDAGVDADLSVGRLTGAPVNSAALGDLMLAAPANLTYLSTDNASINLPPATGGDGDYTYTLTGQEDGAALPHGLSPSGSRGNRRLIVGYLDTPVAVGTYTLAHGVSDGAGGSVTNEFMVTINEPAANAPTITGASFDRSVGGTPYTTGDDITLTMTFNQAVSVAGCVGLLVRYSDNRTSFPCGGAGAAATELAFTATVQHADFSDGVFVNANAFEVASDASIQSAGGVDADIRHAAVRGAAVNPTTTTPTTPTNTAPVANDDTATVAEGAAVTINVRENDSDDGGANALTVTIPDGQTTPGTLRVSGGNVRFTHDGSEPPTGGTFTFSYRVADRGGLSDTATVTVTVTPVNDAPTTPTISAPTANAMINSGQTGVTLTGAATDADGDSLTYTWSASAGTVTDAAGTTGAWSAPRVPVGASVRSVVITLSVSDGTATVTASVSVRVQPAQPTRLDPGERTEPVRMAILAAIPATTPADATTEQIAAVTTLDLSSDSGNAAGDATLERDDFGGLDGLTTLDLGGSHTPTLTPGVFDLVTGSLTSLTLPASYMVMVGDAAPVTVTAAPTVAAPMDMATTAATDENATVTVTLPSPPLTAVRVGYTVTGDAFATAGVSSRAVGARTMHTGSVDIPVGETSATFPVRVSNLGMLTVTFDSVTPLTAAGAPITANGVAPRLVNPMPPAAVTIRATNRAPTANTDGTTTFVSPDGDARLDGSRSTDPDNGDMLTFAWMAPTPFTLTTTAADGMTGTATLTLMNDTDADDDGVGDAAYTGGADGAVATFAVPETADLNQMLTFTLTVTDTENNEDETEVTVTIGNIMQVDEMLTEEQLPDLVREVGAAAANAVAGRVSRVFGGGGAPSLSVAGVGIAADNTAGDAFGRSLATLATTLADDDARDTLINSAFTLPLHGNGGGGGWTLWGEADHTNFDGDSDGVDWDGDLTAIHLGADTAIGVDKLAGVAVSRAESTVDYAVMLGTAAQTGEQELSLTSVSPYFGWHADGVEFWASAGDGDGELELSPDVGDAVTRDASLTSVGVGGARELIDNDRYTLKLTGGVTASELDLDAEATLPSASVSANRARVGVVASRERAVDGGTMVMSASGALRHDGGDGDGGTGGEVGFDARYFGDGVTLNLRAHVLLGRDDYDEWGVSGGVAVTPRHGRGLSFTLTPVYGGQRRGVDELFDNGADTVNRLRLDTELGYGLSWREGLLTPFTQFTLTDTDREFNFGARLLTVDGLHTTVTAGRDGDGDDRIVLKFNLNL